MKISPYLMFSGNCIEAIALYEKAFSVKAHTLRYKDAPADSGHQPPPGTEDFVMHSQFELGGETMMFCDTPPDYPMTVGQNIAVMVEFDNEATLKAAFDVLKEGGEVAMEPQKTFWSECFGSLTDKFKINWNLSIVESK